MVGYLNFEILCPAVKGAERKGGEVVVVGGCCGCGCGCCYEIYIGWRQLGFVQGDVLFVLFCLLLFCLDTHWPPKN